MYKILQGNMVQNILTGAVFPSDPATGNRHSIEYAGWLTNGNTPEPADVIDHTVANISQLWQAAHDYEYAQISGSAIGLLALGVAANRPKALVVQAWIHSIWALYYQRKALVTGEATIDPALLDFSSCGPISHTVPELMTEAGF